MKKLTLSIAVLFSLLASYSFIHALRLRGACGILQSRDEDEYISFLLIGISFVLVAAAVLMIFLSRKTKHVVWWLGIFNFIILPALFLTHLLLRGLLDEYVFQEASLVTVGMILWASTLPVSLLVLWKKKKLWLFSNLACLLSLAVVLGFVVLSMATYAVLSPAPQSHGCGG